MSSPAQVEFFFIGPPLHSTGATERTDYAGFSLNGIEYRVGDCVYLYPENEGPNYVAQVRSCFQDTRGRAADPHCVEVAWFERRAHLDVADVCVAEFELRSPLAVAKEVVALEETDVNPIGCISGKALVFKAPCYEEASRMAASCGVETLDWFFCRGVYKHSEKCILPFPEFAELLAADCSKRLGKRAKAGAVGELVADSDDVKRQRYMDEQPAAPMRRTGKLVSGRTCVECGATQTPQWREGPAGPKTLCNACGVRYGRAQQRANKRPVSNGLSRAAYGSGGRNGRTSKATKPEAPPVARVPARAAPVSAAGEETSQRPLRQAALMSASRTAAYARTGFFPVNSAELEAQMAEAEEGAEPEVQGAEQLLPLPAAAAALPLLAQAQEGAACGLGASPDSSSFDLIPTQPLPAEAGGAAGCGAQAGVHVEVVVVDGGGCSGSGAAGCNFYPLLASQPPLLLSPSVFTDSGIMPALAPDVVVAAAAVGPFGCETPLPLPPASAVVGYADGELLSGLPGAGGCGSGCDARNGVITDADAEACGWMTLAADASGGCGADAVDEAMCALQEPAAELDAVAVGCDAAGPCLSGADAADGGCAAQVVSAPVSPSAHLPAYGDAGCAADGGLYGSCSGSRCGGALYDDEYGPLVEVELDYGLGSASEALGCGCMAGADLFGELQDGCAPDCAPLPVSASSCLPAVSLPASLSAADLPALAATAARYCPTELAPGTAARELLDALPQLTRPAAAQQQQQAGQQAPAQQQAAALPESAVAPLVSLGAQVERASCEAEAADAALQAVSQVLEAHKEAARRAREAAAANLGRLHSCLSNLAGHDAATAALKGMATRSGTASAAGASRAPAASVGASHLIDLRDLCGGGMGAYGRDAERVVAVRS